MSEWIFTKDRKPDPYQRIWFTDGEWLAYGYRQYGDGYIVIDRSIPAARTPKAWDGNEITAWLPVDMPEPPEVEHTCKTCRYSGYVELVGQMGCLVDFDFHRQIYVLSEQEAERGCDNWEPKEEDA